jgi:hypothetical protein
MGLGPSKEKIRKILEKSMTNPNSNEQKNLKIEYKYKQGEIMDIEDSTTNTTNTEGSDYQENGDSFNFSTDDNQTITSPLQDVKNIKKFPYIAIGTITVRFPLLDEDREYTCFLIDTNVVVTLASNIDDKSKGGRAKTIKTTFSNEKVKPENIHIQGEDDKKEKKKQKTTTETLDSLSKGSKLAVILYEDNIGSEWIGVEGGKAEDFSGRDINVVFTLGRIKDGNTNKDEEANEEEANEENKSKKNKEPGLREVNVNNSNPFRKLETDEERNIAEKVPGSPIYYKDYNSGGYVVAIVNESYEFQYFDREAMIFLSNMVNQGKLLRKKTHKGIDEDNIVKLDLSRNDFGPLDIKYLTDFDLKNLRILDLSSNSIKPQGAFYLSQGKFSCLESLNLNFNEIGDEGLNHIANGFFSKLLYLYLFHNNISVEGIKYLVKAEFVNNLIILSLSENPNIGDTGIRIMKEHKGWSKLNTLNLNATGLTDDALKYLGEASMPKLKKLNILGNKFTENGKPSINGLRMNHIHVSYRSQAERDKEKERRSKEAKKK